MKRLFDIVLAVWLLTVLSIPMGIIAALICLGSKGQALYWSSRIGKDNTIFKMPKFRTMRQGTPAVATHLLSNPEIFITPIGKVLRKLSLDELPQLFSVFKGDMSFVGPRPALFNQFDLMELRSQKGVHRLIPGVTGWAQINGRDELPIPKTSPETARTSEDMGWSASLSRTPHYPLGSLESISYPDLVLTSTSWD
jgi:O-antigen biosynthesis protein WbqP